MYRMFPFCYPLHQFPTCHHEHLEDNMYVLIFIPFTFYSAYMLIFVMLYVWKIERKVRIARRSALVQNECGPSMSVVIKTFLLDFIEFPANLKYCCANTYHVSFKYYNFTTLQINAILLFLFKLEKPFSTRKSNILQIFTYNVL